MVLPFTGVASDETGQLDVALSGATEKSALFEEGQSVGQRGSSILKPHPYALHHHSRLLCGKHA